jgi:4-amino-4-deoxy-L-arabinose transferase-like glycosyltransferase
MQKRFNWPKSSWLTVTTAVVGLLGVSGELLFRLSSLTYHRLAAPEVQAAHAALGWREIIANPLGLPLLVLQRLFAYVNHSSVFWLRVPSVLAGVFAVMLFYYIVRRWFNRFTAAISTLLLASSPLFLHSARLVGLDVLYFLAPLALCAYATHVARRKDDKAHIPLWLLFSLITVGFYIPGFLWLFVVVIFLQPSILMKPWRQNSSLNCCLSILAALVVLIPLARALYLQPKPLIRNWLGVGDVGNWHAVLHRLLEVPYNLFVHGPIDHILWLGRIPLIPIAITALALLGAYELTMNRRRQAILLASLTGTGWLICGIGGLVPVVLLVGPLYIAAAAGIRHLSNQWFHVFPRNPFARSIGYAVIAVFCAAMVSYGWHAYFVAWPHNAATHQVFTATPTPDDHVLIQ